MVTHQPLAAIAQPRASWFRATPHPVATRERSPLSVSPVPRLSPFVDLLLPFQPLYGALLNVSAKHVVGRHVAYNVGEEKSNLVSSVYFTRYLPVLRPRSTPRPYGMLLESFAKVFRCSNVFWFPVVRSIDHDVQHVQIPGWRLYDIGIEVVGRIHHHGVDAGGGDVVEGVR